VDKDGGTSSAYPPAGAPYLASRRQTKPLPQGIDGCGGLASIGPAATVSAAGDPARRQSVNAGWELFKRELHLHHTTEDEIIWPVLRPRLAHSEHAAATLAQLPPPLRLLYRARWKPRFERTPRW
jgi:hypothetical protein